MGNWMHFESKQKQKCVTGHTCCHLSDIDTHLITMTGNQLSGNEETRLTCTMFFITYMSEVIVAFACHDVANRMAATLKSIQDRSILGHLKHKIQKLIDNLYYSVQERFKLFFSITDYVIIIYIRNWISQLCWTKRWSWCRGETDINATFVVKIVVRTVFCINFFPHTDYTFNINIKYQKTNMTH